MTKQKKILLTGDRPTGPLHIGHYIGSLINRVKLQDTHENFIMLADSQALTDNFDDIDKVKNNIFEVLSDYLACGIDPSKSTIFIQSMVPALSEITQYLLNVISINRIGHNPTVKNEIKQKGYAESVPAGFYLYPIFQVADIVAFDADVVPVGRDQAPMLELCRDVAGKYNQLYGDVLVLPEPMYPTITNNLPGIDGNKMSKSLGNAISLLDTEKEIAKKIKKMKSDSSRQSINDPGDPSKAVAFSYLDAFDEDKEAVESLKNQYRQGGLGDKVVKERTLQVIESLIAPIRERRIEIRKDKNLLESILAEGTEKAKEKAEKTLSRCKKAMGIDYTFLKKALVK